MLFFYFFLNHSPSTSSPLPAQLQTLLTSFTADRLRFSSPSASSLFGDDHATALSTLPPLLIRPPTTASSSSITAVINPGLFLLLRHFSLFDNLNDASLFFETAAAVDLRLSSLSSPFLLYQSTRSLLHGPSFPISSPTTQEGLRSPTTMAAASLPSSSSPSLYVFLPPAPPPAFSTPISIVAMTSAPVAVSSLPPSSSDPSPSTSCSALSTSQGAPRLGLLFRLLFRRSRLPLHFSSPRPSFSVVGSRCHHLAAAVALLHRLPPLLSLLCRRSHPSPASSSSSSSPLGPLPSSR